jgi:hypothetical protein
VWFSYPSPTPISDPISTPAPTPVPDSTPSPTPDSNTSFTPSPTSDPANDTINFPDLGVPDVPSIGLFDITDLDHFRYDASTLIQNINTQMSSAQDTFQNAYNSISNGFPTPNISDGSCGNSLQFSFAGKSIDLCASLTAAVSPFTPLFQFIFFIGGLLIAFKIFLIGLKD